MNEFELINHYFSPLKATDDDNIIVNIGDDGAVIDIDPESHLVVSTDTLVNNVHFLASFDPFDIAYKALMVNISDMAAMGAQPKYITLALTLPDTNKEFLSRFAQGIDAGCKKYNVRLIGGDLTKGPLSITITILGMVKKNQALTRNGAKLNDIIMVSGALGLGRLSYEYLDLGLDIEENDLAILKQKLLHPSPQVTLGQELLGNANACIDISDGLAADLSHILKSSNVGATLDLSSLPIDKLVKKYINKTSAVEFVLNSGDEYELCFTLPSEKLAQYFNKKYNAIKIGVVDRECGLKAVDAQCNILDVAVKGYSHF